MRNNKAASLFPKELVIESLKQSFVKLNPRVMFRNPIMFIVEVVTFVMLFVTIWAVATGDTTQGSFGYNMLVFIVLFATLLFANFAEAIAEARGKAQADSLRKPAIRFLPMVRSSKAWLLSTKALLRVNLLR